MATTIAVHNGKFHADDVCAVATLLLYLGAEGPHDPNVEIIRTRDQEQIDNADYAVDVGQVYDPEKNRFDHHQEEGAGVRENGIAYAAFGLVWKHFGVEVAGGEKQAKRVDDRMATPLDAADNGEEYFSLGKTKLWPYTAAGMVGAFLPTWKEEQDMEHLDKVFMDLVAYAMAIIKREVAHAQSVTEGHERVLKAYNEAEDKRVMILDIRLPWEEQLEQYPEPLYVVYPQDKLWRARAIRSGEDLFSNRKDFPKEWGGKKGEELAAVTGVEDALFCHRKLFTIAAKSREAIMALVKQALEY